VKYNDTVKHPSVQLDFTRDIITPHAGLALLGEFAVGLGLLQSVDTFLPKPGSGAGYNPSEYICPLILMLNGGCRSLEDTCQVRANEVFAGPLPTFGLRIGEVATTRIDVQEYGFL